MRHKRPLRGVRERPAPVDAGVAQKPRGRALVDHARNFFRKRQRGKNPADGRKIRFGNLNRRASSLQLLARKLKLEAHARRLRPRAVGQFVGEVLRFKRERVAFERFGELCGKFVEFKRNLRLRKLKLHGLHRHVARNRHGARIGKVHPGAQVAVAAAHDGRQKVRGLDEPGDVKALRFKVDAALPLAPVLLFKESRETRRKGGAHVDRVVAGAGQFCLQTHGVVEGLVFKGEVDLVEDRGLIVGIGEVVVDDGRVDDAQAPLRE